MFALKLPEPSGTTSCSLYHFVILTHMDCHVSSLQAVRYNMQQAERPTTQRKREDEKDGSTTNNCRTD